jgi:hypothetical protein
MAACWAVEPAPLRLPDSEVDLPVDPPLAGLSVPELLPPQAVSMRLAAATVAASVEKRLSFTVKSSRTGSTHLVDDPDVKEER